MGKVVTNPDVMTRPETDELDATMARNGFACPELGRGGFFPVVDEDDDSVTWRDRAEQFA